MVKALYPGTFDPVHNGHLDIAVRASRLFDTLIVAVYETPPKNTLFAPHERVDLFKCAVESVGNVEVTSFSGLTPHFAREIGAEVIVRGLRAGPDFDTESELALMWRQLDSGIDVACLISELKYQFVFSSRIKEVAHLGGDVSALVPEAVSTKLRDRFKFQSQEI